MIDAIAEDPKPTHMKMKDIAGFTTINAAPNRSENNSANKKQFLAIIYP